jgi:anti-sigma B factor antagonist
MILDLTGKFTTADDVSQLRRKVIALILRGERNIVFNLAGLTELDSTGLGGLVTCHARACRNDVAIKLAEPGRNVYDLMHLTRLLTVFECYASVEEAFESFEAAALV